MFKISRRFFLELLGMSFAATGLGCAKPENKKAGKKLLILGFDGMDYNIVNKMMDNGELPNFKKVAKGGSFIPLISTTPPQSPVAWSSFITGKNPGGHGIYDFIARDPKTYMPAFSLSKVSASENSVNIGGYAIPLSSGKIELLRKGKAWWKVLEENKIPATIINVPSNFPPVNGAQRSISGMGTPDILGTYGTFSFYTSEPVDRDRVQGGQIKKVSVSENIVESELQGPKDSLKQEKDNVNIPFKVYIDPDADAVKFSIQDREILLKEGEWSDWLRVKFPLSPLFSIKGIIRVYLKSLRPFFRLYISPVNIDPAEPSVPISAPADYSAEVADKLGEFYTQGIPEETWALNEGRLNEDEFLTQASLVRNERTAVFKMELERFKNWRQGVYFCYFGTTDTGSHMFWCHRDPKHPLYDPAYSPKYSKAIDNFYIQMDSIVGHALKEIPDGTDIMIMSDHGFTPFYRNFHVNRWLYENGYISLVDSERDSSDEFFENVDWSRTKAYALGLNGVYLNLKGREGQGIVGPGERKEVLSSIMEGLSKAKDPDNGETIVSNVYDSSKIYSGGYVAEAPDIILGYNTGYRSSWETALGKIPEITVNDNMKKWSGDHCMDPSFVPGIFFCSRKIDRSSIEIKDIAPSILTYNGIKPPSDMDGKTFF